MSSNDSVANLFLHIEGDNEADDDLARLQGQLEVFDDTSAEATAKVKTKGEGELAALAGQLAMFDDNDQEVVVKAKTKDADRELQRFWKRNQLALFEWSKGLQDVGRNIHLDDKDIDVDVNVHQQELNLLGEQLRMFDAEHVDADADVNTAKGTVKLSLLQRALQRFARTKVSAEAEVDKDGRASSAAGNLWRSFVKLTTGAESASRGGNRLRASFGMITGLTVQTAIAVYSLVAALGVALITALGAVVASAAAAAVALGALAIAAGGAGLAIGGLIGFAIFRFQDLAKKGGQVAQELKRSFSQTGAILARELSPTVRPIFRALTAELRNLRPAIMTLREPFMALGGAAAASIKIIGDEVRQLMPQFRALLFSAAPIMPLLAQGAGALLGIFLNIANVAMPYLIQGLTKVVGWLRQFQQYTSTKDFADDIEVVVGHLKSWLNLGWQISRVFLEFFKAAAPLGKDIVDDLAKGAEHLADWIKNNPDKVQQFLKDMIGVARDLWGAFVALVAAAISFGQAVAPALAIVIPIITILLGMLKSLLDAINGLPGPIRLVASMFLLFLGPVGFVRVLITILGRLVLFMLGPLLGAIGRVGLALTAMAARGIAAGAALAGSLFAGLLARMSLLAAAIRASMIGAIASSAVGAVSAGLSAGAAIVGSLAAGVATRAAFLALALRTAIATAMASAFISISSALSLGGAIISSIVAGIISRASLLALALRTAIGSALPAAAGLAARFTLIGGAIVGAISTGMFLKGISSIRSGITRVLQAALQGAVFPFRIATLLGFDLVGAIADGIEGGVGKVKGAVESLVGTVKEKINEMKTSAADAARGIGDGIAQGIASGQGKARAAGGSLVNAAAAGISGSAGLVQQAASNIGQSALQPIQAAASSAGSAGAALGNNFANGIASTLGAVIAGAQKIAAAARAQFHGSEPKDTSSPLRGFGKAAEGLVVTYARGLKKAGPMLINALDEVLTQMELRIDRLSDSSTRKAARIRQSLEAMIPRIEKLKAFQEAILELGSKMLDVANNARDAWIDLREQMQLAALAGTPEGQELAALLAGQKKSEADFTLRGLNEEVSDAQAKLAELNAEKVDPLRDRPLHDIEADIVAQERAIRDAQDRITQFQNQQRIDQLTAVVDAKRDEITQRAQIARDGFDQEANAYRDSLTAQFDALQGMLARGEISYATFVRRVRKVLGPLADMFQLDPRDEVVLRGGRNFINAFIEGMNSMRGRAKAILRDILKDLRDMLPGSEPRDRNSPLRGLAGPGEAVMENLASGLDGAGRIVLKSLYAELSPIAAIAPALAVRANPIGAGGGNVYHYDITKNFNLPPGPGGGYEPMFAASQLDKIMQDEGGWGP